MKTQVIYRLVFDSIATNFEHLDFFGDIIQLKQYDFNIMEICFLIPSSLVVICCSITNFTSYMLIKMLTSKPPSTNIYIYLCNLISSAFRRNHFG